MPPFAAFFEADDDGVSVSSAGRFLGRPIFFGAGGGGGGVGDCCCVSAILRKLESSVDCWEMSSYRDKQTAINIRMKIFIVRA